MKRLKELEQENGRLKRMYADLSLENAALKEVLAKKLYGLLNGGRWWPIWSVRAASRFSGPVRQFVLSRATYYRPVVNWAQRDGPVIRSANHAGRDEISLGVLEICGSVAEHRTSVEPQAALARVLPTPAEPATADEETAPGSASPASRGHPAPERGVGGGLHERHPIRRPTISDVQHSG